MSTERNTKRTKRDEKALDTRLMTVGELLARQNIAEISDEAYSEKKMPLFFRYKLERDLRKAVAKAQAERKAKMLRKNDPEPFSPCGNRAGRSHSWLGFKKAILIVVASILIMSSVSVTVSAWSFPLMDFFISRLEKCFDISFITDKKVPTYLIEKREPHVYPESWEKRVRLDSQGIYNMEYMWNGKWVCRFTQLIIQDNAVSIDNKDTVIHDIKVGNYNGRWLDLRDKKYNYITWSDGEYMYLLSARYGTISVHDLIVIAESVN